MTKLRQFLRDKNGATAIEYALIGAGISILIVAGITTIGSRLSAQYLTKIAGNLS